MKKNILYPLMILCYLLFCCIPQSNEAIELLRGKYTPQVFNYFYEVALHSELITNKLFSIQKWENNIYLFIQGDTIKGDRAIVRKVIRKINSLKLPITLYETLHAGKANFVVTFKLREKVDHNRVRGTGTFYAAKGIIYHASIKIFYDSSKQIYLDGRTDTVFEEVTQCLGLPGDSYSYPESIFYQGDNSVENLSELDIQLLNLLYEPTMVPNYELTRYENDFGDLLYNINAKHKLLHFLNNKVITAEAMSAIYQHSLSKDPMDGREKVSKYHYPTHVVLKGEYPPEFKTVINKTISEINTISENLKLILIDEDSLIHDGGIHFEFIKDSQMVQDSAYWKSKHSVGLLFPRNTKNEIIFKYRDHDKLMDNIRKAIPNLIYKSVCLSNAEKTDFYDYNHTDFQLKPLYREILHIYYDNSLPSGFTKEELEEVIKQYTTRRQ